MHVRASRALQDAALPALALPNDPLRNGVEAFIARIGRGQSIRRTAELPPDLQPWAAATDERFTHEPQPNRLCVIVRRAARLATVLHRWLPQMRGLLRDHWGHQACWHFGGRQSRLQSSQEMLMLTWHQGRMPQTSGKRSAASG